MREARAAREQLIDGQKVLSAMRMLQSARQRLDVLREQAAGMLAPTLALTTAADLLDVPETATVGEATSRVEAAAMVMAGVSSALRSIRMDDEEVAA